MAKKVSEKTIKSYLDKCEAINEGPLTEQQAEAIRKAVTTMDGEVSDSGLVRILRMNGPSKQEAKEEKPWTPPTGIGVNYRAAGFRKGFGGKNG